jgi:cyclophilin family peptidyl-prolyl cis-trans isomerase
MVQTGDPNSKDDDWTNDGFGGPGYYFEDEINEIKLVKGKVAMANSGKGTNTNGSQFFIVTAESTPWLDGSHTVFGEVMEGMDAVDKIEAVQVNENDHPMTDVVVNKVHIEKVIVDKRI